MENKFFNLSEIDTTKLKFNDIKNGFLLGDRLDALKLLPNNSVSVFFTSPPYNVGKDYTKNKDNKPYEEYVDFLVDTWEECYKKLKPGGRLILNIPNLIGKNASLDKNKGINYLPLYSDIITKTLALNKKTFINDEGEEENFDFFINGEIFWYKQNVLRRTAWGSWASPSSPYVVYPYELIIVLSKKQRKLEGKKENIDITPEEFINYSMATWTISPETSKRWHPAPFPKELAYRILKFYSFKGDLVVDPFSGTGTFAEVAHKLERDFVYIDNSPEYIKKAMESIYNEKELKFNMKSLEDYQKSHKILNDMKKYIKTLPENVQEDFQKIIDKHTKKKKKKGK